MSNISVTFHFATTSGNGDQSIEVVPMPLGFVNTAAVTAALTAAAAAGYMQLGNNIYAWSSFRKVILDV